MASFSSVVVMGNLTRDPDVRNAAGKEVVQVSVALNKKRGDKEYAVFIEAEFWEKQAEFVTKWFNKGDAILIQGELDRDEWEDKNTGQKRTKHVIRNCRASFAGGKKEAGGETNTSASSASVNGQTDDDDVPF